jgi:hypothetical protein
LAWFSHNLWNKTAFYVSYPLPGRGFNSFARRNPSSRGSLEEWYIDMKIDKQLRFGVRQSSGALQNLSEEGWFMESILGQRGAKRP